MDFSSFPGEVRVWRHCLYLGPSQKQNLKKKDLEEDSLFERWSQEQGWGTRGNDREGGDALLRLVGHCCGQPGLDPVGTYKRPLRNLCLPSIGWQFPGNVNFLYFQAAHVGCRLMGSFRHCMPQHKETLGPKAKTHLGQGAVRTR